MVTGDLVDGYERGLLAALMNGWRDVPAVTRVIGERDFYRPAYGQVFQAITELHAAGSVINPLTVRDHLGPKVLLKIGNTLLTDLYAEPWSDPLWCADKVRDARVRRDIAALGSKCEQIVEDTDATPEELAAKIRAWADEITTGESHSFAGIEEALEEVIYAAEHGQQVGIPTPWPCLNELVELHPGQLVTFAARPGVGKSIALENLATQVARSGRWVLYVSLEMSKMEVTQRTMAHTARVHLSKIRRGRDALTELEWDDLSRAYTLARTAKIRFTEAGRQTVGSIRAEAWDLHQYAKRREEPFGLVVVDYVQLVNAVNIKGASRQQQIGEITRGLKQLAMEFKVPVVMAAAVKRIEGRAPTMSDVREAGDVEQDSDIVVLMHTEDIDDGSKTYASDDVEFIVDKNRHGPRGKRTVQRFGHYAYLYDAQATA